jgi:hypothetical protein
MASVLYLYTRMDGWMDGLDTTFKACCSYTQLNGLDCSLPSAPIFQSALCPVPGKSFDFFPSGYQFRKVIITNILW